MTSRDAPPTHLGLQSLDEIVQEGRLPVHTGLCVDDFVEAGQFESRCIAPVPSVHEVPKSQHDLKEFTQLLAGRELPAGKEDILHLRPQVFQSLIQCLLEIESLQSLAIARDPIGEGVKV